MKQIFLILLIFCGVNAFSQKIVKDTLIVSNETIKFIKIGNEVYELQKSITLKKVEGSPLLLQQLPWVNDTMSLMPYWMFNNGGTLLKLTN